jgi:adenosylhomocysteine nucleosidase
VDVVVVRSGIGKVNAAVCTQVLVDDFHVTHIINTGVAGALDPRIDVGDIVISTDAIYYDVDVTVFGYEPGQVPQMPVVDFAADEALRAAAMEAAREVAPEVGIFEGRVCSGDRFVSDEALKESINKTFEGLCCEMEGTAIAQTAWLNKVPFVIVRAISDKADGSDVMDYVEFEAVAARHCAGIVCAMVASLA